MAEIDGLGYMLEVLRRRISSNTTRADRLTTSSHKAAKSKSNQQVTPKATLAELRERVRDRISAIPHESLGNEEHAARVFLESVLLWEFGDDLPPSPELAGLVSDITAEMRSHPELSKDLNTLINELMHK